MYDMEILRNIAQKIYKSEEKKKQIAKKIGKKGFGSAGDFELNCTVGGIDGGIVAKSLHSVDFLLVRAACPIYTFKNNKLAKVDYFPSVLPSPEIHYLIEGETESDFNQWKSIKRLKAEIGLADRVVKEKKPDYLMLDGSLLPQHADKPKKGTELEREFQELVEIYDSLFSCDDCCVIGIVEDSRGKRFLEISKSGAQLNSREKEMLERSTDSNILDYLLNVGERSLVFDYSQNPEQHPVLKEIKLAKRIKCFYLKTTSYDRPLRVEFLNNKRADMDNIASLVYQLSNHYPYYGYPSVLTEADLQAKLHNQDIEELHSQLHMHTGEISSLRKKRREVRPFG